MEKLKQKDYIYDLYQYYKVGDTVTQSGKFAQTILRIFIKASDRTDLRRYIREVMQSIQVYNENGESLLLDSPLFEQ